MRRLIHIPILHGVEDLGSQLDEVRRAHISRYGVRSWHQHLHAVAQFWSDVRRRARALDQPGCRLRIYQDGLPVCGREEELARQLAEAGSANYRMIVDLMEHGAVLTGTERPALLELEQSRYQAGGVLQPASAAYYDTLMEQRDRYIAARIGATLGAPPETGLLLMGALHRVTLYLPPDIQVSPLRP